MANVKKDRTDQERVGTLWMREDAWLKLRKVAKKRKVKMIQVVEEVILKALGFEVEKDEEEEQPKKKKGAKVEEVKKKKKPVVEEDEDEDDDDEEDDDDDEDDEDDDD